MRAIASTLESQQIPLAKVVNWQPMHNRSVLAIEGGTPGDLDFRFKMNRILRSTHKGTSKIAHLRTPKKATVSWADTKFVPVEELQQLLEEYSQRQSALRMEVKELCERHGKPIPVHFLPPGTQETLAAGGKTIELTKSRGFLAIQKEQEFTEALEKFSRENHLIEISRKLTEDTIVETQRTRATELLRAKKQYNESATDPTVPFNVSPECLFVQSHARLPKLVEAVQGLTLEYYSSMQVLPQDYAPLAAFIGRHGDDSRWCAPQEALDPTGKPLPLTQRWDALCTKNLALSDRSIKSINKELKEALAWRWLIISWNHACATPDRVKIPPKLSLAYERQRRTKKEVSLPETSSQLESIRDLVTSFVKDTKLATSPREVGISRDNVRDYVDNVWATAKFLTSSYADPSPTEAVLTLKPEKPTFKCNVDRWNKLLEQGAALYEGASIELIPDEGKDTAVEKLLEQINSAAETRLPQESDYTVTFDDAEWLASHPESFDKDGLCFFRFDIDFIDIAEGQTFVSMMHNGVEYRAITGTPSGPAKSAKAKGKTAVVPKETKSARVPSPKSKDKGESSKNVPPLARENPLHVKGEPKSKALSDDQRKTLRTFFKLKEGLVPPEEWATLDSSGRSAAMKERSIPRWASEAVLRSPANLQLIIEGKLTVENANSVARTPRAGKTKNSSAALEAWQQLKSDFKGTALLKSPQTTKEKAFRKRFDQLVADYGQQPCFPKLRERPDQQGRPDSKSRGRAPARGQASDFLDIAKAMGEIARAFSGK
jgi:hypothetical protein